jgi:hypothetical protein
VSDTHILLSPVCYATNNLNYIFKEKKKVCNKFRGSHLYMQSTSLERKTPEVASGGHPSAGFEYSHLEICLRKPPLYGYNLHLFLCTFHEDSAGMICHCIPRKMCCLHLTRSSANLCCVWGSPSNNYEECYLLRCGTTQFGRSSLTFRRNILEDSIFKCFHLYCDHGKKFHVLPSLHLSWALTLPSAAYFPVLPFRYLAILFTQILGAITSTTYNCFGLVYTGQRGAGGQYKKTEGGNSQALSLPPSPGLTSIASVYMGCPPTSWRHPPL